MDPGPEGQSEDSLLSIDDISETLDQRQLDDESSCSTTSKSIRGVRQQEQSNKDNDVMELDADDDILEVSPSPVVHNVSKKSTGAPQNMGNKIAHAHASPSPSPAPSSVSSSYQKKAASLTDNLKFMADFDPENSSRNQQKRKKRYHPNDGRLIQYADDFEDCDCLRVGCMGCHYPCNSCGDSRCGHECRVSRRWMYESVEVEGRNQDFKNRHVTNFS